MVAILLNGDDTVYLAKRSLCVDTLLQPLTNIMYNNILFVLYNVNDDNNVFVYRSVLHRIKQLPTDGVSELTNINIKSILQ